MKQRTFLKTSVIPPAVSTTGWSVKSYSQSPVERSGGPKLKLSLNAYSFNKPLREGKMSLDELLSFCAKLNFDAVDPTGYYFPNYPHVPTDKFIYDFKRKAFLLGLDISGTGMRNDFAVPDAEKRKADVQLIKEWIKVAAKMGAPVLRVFAGRKVPPDYTWDQTAEWVAAGLRECADYAAEYGVIITLQNHAGFLKTADDVLKILKMVDSKWLGLMLDIGSFPTKDPYRDIEKVIPYAVTWQIKEKVKTIDSPVKTDLPRLFKIISNANYRGYLPIETLGEGDPKEKVTKFLQQVKKVLG